jgi:histidyl-tRNA synthetase
MAPSKKTYKGCRDFFPEDMRVRDYLFNKMRKVAEEFAYEGYDGPLLEEVDLYRAKSGEELINDQIYSFTDRGSREVAIRPEMTPTVARMVANVHKQAAKPLRWYSIPNLMRYEKPQRGRVREHWQFNVDIFGAPINLGEIEILCLIKNFLCGFGADHTMFSILLNDRRVVDSVFKNLLSLDKESSHKLYKVIDKAKKVTPEKLDTMINEIILEDDKKILFKSYLDLNSFDSLAIFIEKNSIQEQCSEFIEFMGLIKKLGIEEFIQYDPTIVRGLDYYTGVVFEIFDKHPENNRAIAGGGAYANLLQIFNETPLAGVGFGLGDVTLKDFLNTHKLLGDFSKAKNDLFIVYTDQQEEINALKLANALRDKGIKVESYLGKLKFNKIFKLAETKGHNLVAIVEKNSSGEINIQVKNLEERTVENCNLAAINKIIEFIK